MSPKRIQRRRAKGWRMPENTVCVDRSTPWGNPFVIDGSTTREEAVFAHKALLHGYLCVTQRPTLAQQEAYVAYVKQNLSRLRAKNLACFCRLDQACHADFLLQLANGRGRRSRRRAAQSGISERGQV